MQAVRSGLHETCGTGGVAQAVNTNNMNTYFTVTLLTRAGAFPPSRALIIGRRFCAVCTREAEGTRARPRLRQV